MRKPYQLLTASIVTAMVFGSAATYANPSPADAYADYPSKPITLIVPFPAANVSDMVARLVAEEVSKKFGQSIIIENKAGGSGSIGLSAAARSAPDGYTWVIGTAGALITAPLTQKSLSFDPENDFKAVTMMAPLPMMIVARPELPADTLEDLVKYARANPEKVDYASLGVGSFPHLAGELLKEQAKVDLLHVPYKGSSQATTDLLGGRVNIMFDTVPPAMAQIRAGKLKALAITSAESSEVAPGIPPISATPGFEGYEAISWTGLFVPANTPDPIVQKINAAVAEALANPAIKKRFLDMGLELKSSSPEGFSEFVKNERAKWSGIAQQAGLAPQ